MFHRMFHQVELKPDGGNIDVTDANKEEFVQLRFKRAMLDSISDPLGKLLGGFYSVVPFETLSRASLSAGEP